MVKLPDPQAQPMERCGAPTSKCECLHTVQQHLTGPCGECACQSFTPRPCSRRAAACPNHVAGRKRRGGRPDAVAAFELALRGTLNGDVTCARDSCGVYFIRCLGFVKIGFTSCLSDRLNTLAGAVPFELEVVAFVHCEARNSSAVERGLHERFRASRHRGEWFRLESPLVEFIESIKAGAP